jgi:YHS domain-containing protein
MYRLFVSIVILIMTGAGMSVIQTGVIGPQAFAEDMDMKGHEHGDEHANAPQVRKPKPEEIGQMAVCAVKGTKFEVASNTPVIDYKGKTYYFCCDHCLHEFQENPDKFAK